MEATKEEMKTEIHSVQDVMNIKIGQLDRKNKHQVTYVCKPTEESVLTHSSILLSDSDESLYQIIKSELLLS